MAKTRTLAGDDLKVKPKTESATRQRGAYPSDELVPMQFRMPLDFVDRFKAEALRRRVKLNELFALSFDALMKK